MEFLHAPISGRDRVAPPPHKVTEKNSTEHKNAEIMLPVQKDAGI